MVILASSTHPVKPGYNILIYIISKLFCEWSHSLITALYYISRTPIISHYGDLGSFFIFEVELGVSYHVIRNPDHPEMDPVFQDVWIRRVALYPHIAIK